MSASSILNGKLSYMEICVIATTCLRKCVKPSVLSARPQQASAPISAIQQAASSPASNAGAISTPQFHPTQILNPPVKLRRRSLPLTRDQIIIGVSFKKQLANMQQ